MSELTLAGNLSGDPELRFTASGLPVANFTVCHTPRVWHKESGEYRDGETIFMRCSIWRDAAEHVAESLRRGDRVLVTGRVKSRSWETDAGEKRTVLELDADEVGPSLRWATAKVSRAVRSSAPAAPDAYSAPAAVPDVA